MLQRRRVFDLTNTIMNYVFMVFLLFAGIYLASFWFELKSEFLSGIVVCANVVAWTVTALSLMLVIHLCPQVEQIQCALYVERVV